MIKNKHKIISVVLCMALVFCSFFALTVTVSAASGTVYVRVPGGWTQAYCYMWTEGSGSNNTWPGVQMTATSESGVYSYAVNGNFNQIIFNNGNSGVGTNQTANLSFSSSNLGQICDITNISSPKWSAYGGGDDPSVPTVPTVPTVPGDGITVFFRNTAGWSNPNCYMWKGEGGAGNENAEWPGEGMTPVEDGVWMYSSSTVYEKCIFNGGGTQTDNLTAYDGQIFDYSTKQWSPYDLSPLQVQSYTADPASNLYTGMEITLSASATSSEGAVSYKFSVNGASIRDWAAGSSTIWTPTAAGSYTVTFDFKDTAGNEITRSLTLDVQSDAGATNPIIKKITPSDNGYVRTGSATISVTAAGGKTGTNLLFYKYEIQDPAGAKNVAYYTLNATYTYNFNREGDYKVKVTVQASDNSEASRSFTIKATGQEIPTVPTDPTDPTYQLGDVNMDGVVDIKDATHFQLFLAQKNGYSVTMELGDMNGDNKLNSRDVTAIQRYVADKV